MWESATDMVANTSTISWTFKVYRSDAYYVEYDRNTGNNFTLIADGTARTNPSPYTNFSAVMKTNGQHESTANTWVSSDMCGSFVVQHNADGAKSFSFTAKYWNTNSGSIGSASSPLTVSGTFYCTTFARASSVYPNYTNVTLGNAVGINVSRASSNFLHFLHWWYEGGHEGIIAYNVTDYYEWTPTLATFAPLMPNTSTHSVAIVCETYNGSTLVGSSTCYVNLIVPQNADTLPTLDSVTTEVVDGFNGNYLQGYSRCKLTMSATARSSATIASYKINNLSNASNPYTSAVINESGEKSYTVTVYDSRGFSATTTKKINVLPYSLPSMTDISVSRCLQDGTLASNGTYLSVYAKENHANITGNSASMSVAWKLTSASSYGTAESLPSETTTIVGSGNILAQRAYNVKLTITDTVGNTFDAVLTIPSDSVSINERADNRGIGLGTYADAQDRLKVNSSWLISTRGIAPVGYTKITRQRQPSGSGDYCHYQRMGNLILVQFSGGITSGTADNTAIATGLPNAVSEAFGSVAIDGQKCAQVSISGTEMYWRDATLSADAWAWGQLIYVTSE